MYLCNGSHDFLSAPRSGLCDSVPNELTHRTVNFITTKHQDARNEDLAHVFGKTKVLEISFNVDFYETFKQCCFKKHLKKNP